MIIVASLVFVLIMGAGMAWNIGPLTGLQPTHDPQTVVNIPERNDSRFAATSSYTTTSSIYIPPPPAGGGNGGASSTSSDKPVNQTAWKDEWISYAQIAWRFFKPGIGVSPTTGLIYASPYWHRFTDWDLGGYIMAVLAAERLGVISTNGNWGAEYRLKLVLNFLDTRPLGPNSTTFQFYDSDTGTVSPDGPPNIGNPIDEGRLLVALYDTKLLHPELAGEIETAIRHVNYAYFASTLRLTPGNVDAYSNYAEVGFSLWGFKAQDSQNYSAPPGGSFITAEPVVSAVLEGLNDPFLTNASREVYLAQYAAYNRSGTLMALSEGQYPPYLQSATPYVYEAIQVPEGTSYFVQTWQGQNVTTSPEAFTKIGFAFYAIYRSSYGSLLVQTFGNLTTSNGYMEGILSQSGQVFNAVSDNSNIMIMEACAYAVNPI